MRPGLGRQRARAGARGAACALAARQAGRTGAVAPPKRGMGLYFTCFMKLPKTYFGQQRGSIMSLWSILLRHFVLGGSPIDWRGSRSILKVRYLSAHCSLFFALKSSYFKPGSLRDKPESIGNGPMSSGMVYLYRIRPG